MKLLEYVEKFGIRKSFLAKKLDVSEQSMRKYLMGENRPPLELLFKIQELTDNRVCLHDWLEVQDPKNDAGNQEKAS